MDSDHADQIAGRLVEGDKGHRAGIVELGQAGDECVRELLDRREEAKSQILRGDVMQEIMDQRLVLGTNRAHERAPPSLTSMCRCHCDG